MRTKVFCSQSTDSKKLAQLKAAIRTYLKSQQSYIDVWAGYEFCVNVIAVVLPGSRQDVDNAVKGLLDAMEGVIYTNDRLVQHLSVRKIVQSETDSFYLVHVKPVRDVREDVIYPYFGHGWSQPEIVVA